MILSLLSAIFGGALRLVPEILKYLGQSQQNAHELSMQDKQLAFLQLQGQIKLQEIGAQGSIDTAKAQMDAIVAVNQAQANEAQAGGWLISAINALVRPSITFFVTFLWGLHKLTAMLYAYHSSGDALGALMGTWTQDDASVFSMILTFYFVGRVWDKQS